MLRQLEASASAKIAVSVEVVEQQTGVLVAGPVYLVDRASNYTSRRSPGGSTPLVLRDAKPGNGTVSLEPAYQLRVQVSLDVVASVIEPPANTPAVVPPRAQSIVQFQQPGQGDVTVVLTLV